jgi:hypothetical protein
MTLDEKIKQERKYSRYGIWLFSIMIVLQIIAYLYEKIMGYQVDFPYQTIIMNLLVIFCFKYTYSLVYLFRCLNQLEERELRKAVQQREERKGI